MIAPDLRSMDIDPRGYTSYLSSTRQLSRSSPQAVLWHEDGIPRRFILGGEPKQFNLSRIIDARQSAVNLFGSYGERVKRVVVTDRAGYERLCRARSPLPSRGEIRYDYIRRAIDRINSEMDEHLGIFPQLTFDRGPVEYETLRAFISGDLPDRCCLFMAVYEEQDLDFNLIALVEEGRVSLITSLDHFSGRLKLPLPFSQYGLDNVLEAVAGEFGAVAGALFLQKREFLRLFNGDRHMEFPSSLILGGRAFGYSHLPGVPETAMLNTVGLFAYVPAWVY